MAKVTGECQTTMSGQCTDTACPDGMKLWERIANAVEGTTDSPAAIAEKYDVPEDQVEEVLSELGLETCPGCGWWWATGELDVEGYCPDCQEG